MEFIFLMLDGEVIRPWTQARQRAAVARMQAYAAELTSAGKFKDSGGLGPDFDAARVRVQDGAPSVLMGPFDGAVQVVGGFMIVECASLEEAIELAKTCPAAEWAPLEVRQNWRH
jgi:hypothetical protein